MEKIRETIDLAGRELSIETGEIARQAGGAVKVSYGDTVLLATCCVAPGRNLPFFPLTVDYRERTYAAGKIPGGFFKREGRPQEKEVITSRLIDRPIRPLFPEGYNDEVQVMISVLSSDGVNNSDVPAMIGGSCAVALSSAPMEGPVGAVRVGKIDGEFIINPTFDQIDDSEFDIIVAGKEGTITMIEGEAYETTEEDILTAIDKAEEYVASIVEIQNKIVAAAGKEKIVYEPAKIDEDLAEKVKAEASSAITEIFKGSYGKQERSSKLSELKEKVIEKLAEKDSETGEADADVTGQIKTVMGKLEKELLLNLVTQDKIRVDGRKPDDLRPITCQAGYLPRTHGSGVFTKGETQSLGVITLGTSSDRQIMDELEGEYKKNFMVHYNFLPFCVGEVRRYFGPKRREIGHGLLAERALFPALPDEEDFPYTIRLVSDILESNGSSSMATVCAGTLALLNGGIKMKAPVAGVGMGIIGDTILTDMLGDEDHAGDMDFKVAGTKKGVTAIQMDIKISGIERDTLMKALQKAKEARLKTLAEIEKEIPEANDELSPWAPQLKTLTIKKSKIGSVIGPGGKNINKIQDESGASVDIDDDGEVGTVTISADSKESMDQAVKMVKGLTDEAEVGKIYEGTVQTVKNYGAFVEVLPGQDGLIHISALAPYRVDKVTDILDEGDKVKVKCIKVDDRGKISLSRVEAMTEEELEAEKKTNSISA
ncbi:MAG: polyribonucleotide nucleotidyltransferase [Elusimicrobia bacterium]|jgi:polyribonucleotide nucleotidyltransferase|nr:polyribonucleotide nucleotidyltransferase [Elusimicrobiota bacterium]